MSNPASWSCFGRLWEQNRVECAGGFDLAYIDPDNESSLRKRCSAYDRCRAAKENKVSYPQYPPYQPYQQPFQPIPAQPQAPQLQAPPLPPPALFPLAQPAPGFRPMQPPMTGYPTTGYAAPWVAQQGPQQVPLPYQQPGAQMPTYLAVPEPLDGTPWWARLLAEVGRSMAKALGHSTASFFDHNPLRSHPAPQPGPQPTIMQPPK
jgi:hypothetical protein